MTKFNHVKSLAILSLSVLASALGAVGCAGSDGNSGTTVEFSLEAKLEAKASALKGNHFVAANQDEIEFKQMTLHLSEVKIISKTTSGGGNVEFDPSNPPEPYENCHANHCHIKGSSDTKTYDEIKAELGGGTVTAKDVLTVAVDKTITLNAFNKEVSLEEFAEGDLDYGDISEVQVTFDRFALEAVNVTQSKNISLKNEHYHGSEVHRESLVLSHPLVMTIDRSTSEHTHVNLVLELNGEFFNEIATSEEIDFADLVEGHAKLELEGEDHDHHDHDH
ncbi:MAG: hypothetical protein IJ165_06815 [Proteobacteria bacterium]|nr:hypothetical protein [Pseudomonadota bacterium]